MATILPTEAESVYSPSPVTFDNPMIGAPRAPKETGALLAMAPTRTASSSATPKAMSTGATTAHG
jgi:hypothetical protein